MGVGWISAHCEVDHVENSCDSSLRSWKMLLKRRIYRDGFSANIALICLGCILISVSYTSVGSVSCHWLPNGNLVFVLRYAGVMALVLSFRAVFPWLKVLHMIASVLLLLVQMASWVLCGLYLLLLPVRILIFPCSYRCFCRRRWGLWRLGTT